MKRYRRFEGFSLVEMMVVLTVVGLIMAFAAPNVVGLIQARTLSSEGSLLRNQLTYAQQLAVSKNADVEVRFYRMVDLSSAQTEPTFTAFQLYQYNSAGQLKPISSFFKIRAPSALNENHSTLLKTGRGGGEGEGEYGFIAPYSGKGPVPTGSGSAKQEMDFVAFRFRPDGSTDLPGRSGKDAWYLTLVQGDGAAKEANFLNIRNFVCLQINPFNGAVSEFRP